MPLPKDLADLLAAAGLAEAAERRRAAANDRRRAAAARRDEKALAEAEARAPENAAAVWAWTTSPEADELREAMRGHGIEQVRLCTLGLVHGERRPAPSFGSVSIDILVDGALYVLLVRGYHGGGARRVASAAALAGVMPSRALAMLAGEIGAGRAGDLVREGLLARLPEPT